MRTKGAFMELDQSSFTGQPGWRGGPASTARGSRASARAIRHPFGSQAFPTTAIMIGLALGVAVYGIVANRDALAAIGLAASFVATTAMACRARASIRRLERRYEVLGRARAESERARHDLEVENAELERRNAELKSEQLAILEGFDWVDERTNGRLSDLVQEAGDELAEFADEVLDDPAEDA